MQFVPLENITNHEQELRVLRYSTKSWAQGSDDNPFHEEVGYFIWDSQRQQLMEPFSIPRGVVVNAGGRVEANASEFTLRADIGSNVYGVCSN